MPDEPVLVPLGELLLIHPASASLPCDVCGAPSRFSLRASRGEGPEEPEAALLCDEDFAEQVAAAADVLEQGARWLELASSARVPEQRSPGEQL